jgi:glucan 1,3-beta-glucosidase
VSPNTTITPWDPIVRPNTHARNVKRSCSPLTPTYPSTFWYEVIDHNGESPFIANGASWEVFRNVKTAYGAAGDGVTDDTAALQNAITAGNSAGNRGAHVFGTTGQPAVVYLPEGVYLISSPLQLYVGTVIIGNPLSPPTIKASAGFSGDFLIYGKDPNLGSTINFYIAMKNLVLDSTNIAASTTFTLLDWSVSQATQLTNLVFNMPDYSTGHTGIAMPEGGSGTMIGDLTFNGGAVGINMSNQQYNLKNIAFVGCTTGIVVSGCFQCTFQSLSFKYNNVGIQYTNSGLGVLIVIDSTATDIGTFVEATAESTGANSLVIENFVDGGGVTNVRSFNPVSGDHSDKNIDRHSERNYHSHWERIRNLGLRQCVRPGRSHNRFSPNRNYLLFRQSIYSPQLRRTVPNHSSTNIRHLRCN